MKTVILTIFLLLSVSTAKAQINEETLQIERYISTLDRVNHLPSLLPLIIENSDVIELTDKQLQTLLSWREEHRQGVVGTLNEIVRKRILIKEAALSPYSSSGKIKKMQSEIFRLQRKVLDYKLACRELVIKTFNENNWDGLFLVLADTDMGISLPDL